MGRRTKPKPRLPIRELPSGALQAYPRINGRQHKETFPAGTAQSVIVAWIERQQAKHGTPPPAADGATTFAQDVTTYLERKDVQRMPTVGQRTAHLALWLHALGRDRTADSVDVAAVTAVIDGWTDGTLPPPPSDARPDGRGRPRASRIKGATIRKRCVALQSFFKALYPLRVNPVAVATKPKESKVEPRALQYVDIERALAAMPDYRSTRKGAPRVLNLSKICAGVIAYTGVPPIILNAVDDYDLDLRARTLRVTGREKGDGVEPRVLELNDDAMHWLRKFHDANAYHQVPKDGGNRSFKRGCKTVGVTLPRVHLYDLRHSYLSEVYRLTGDEATVARVGLHAAGSPMTARYTRDAHADVDRAAAAAFSERRQEQRRGLMKPHTAMPAATPAATRVQVRRPTPARAQLQAVPRARSRRRTG